MPLDFPSSPTNGQTYNGYVYSTSIGAWQAKPSAQSPFYTSDTPPNNPVVGDSWFNTNDGTMYVYVNDGTSSQWVEHRSEIARSQVGLVPIRPTSVTLGSGTSSTDVSGQVTFTSSNAVMLNGIFSNSFKHYRVMIECTGPNDFMFGRFATGGTANSGNNYAYQLFVFQTGAAGGYYTGNDNWVRLGYQPSGRHHKYLDISNPFQSEWTMMTWNAGYGQTINTGVLNIGNTTSFDGFQIFPNSGTLTGTMKVYGYN